MKHNIKILELGYKNFFSVGDNMITIPFKDDVNILISGKNGAGKSTVLSALSYNLYGKTDRDLKKSGVVNNINGKNLYTYTKLLVNGKSCTIERGLKPDILKISVDGVDLDETSSKLGMDKIIVDLLGCDYNTFYKLVAITKTNYTPLLQMKTPDRRVFIENVLDLVVFTDMQKLVKEDLKVVKKEASLLENTITHKKDYIERDTQRLKSNEASQENQISALTAQIINLKDEELPRLTLKKENDLRELTDKIAALTSKDVDDEKIKIQQQISDYIQSVNNLEKELSETAFNQNDYDKLLSDKDILLREISQQEKVYKDVSIELKITKEDGLNIKSNLDAMKHDSTCPLCEKPLTDDKLVTELTKQKDDLLIKYAEILDNKKSIKESLEKLLLNKEELEILIQATLDSKRNRSSLVQKIDTIHSHIEVLQEKDLDAVKDREIHVLQERLNNITQKDYLYEVNLTINSKESELTKLKETSFQDLNDDILKDKASLKDAEDKFDILQDNISYKNFMLTVLDDKGIKANIIDMYIPTLIKNINYYIDKMGLFMYFHMDKEFKEVIKKDHTFDCSYNNLSEGEKQRIDLSIMFAFRDIARSKNYASFNVLFLDDMTGHIDDEGVINILELIEHSQDDTITVMINHDHQKFEGIFENVITFIKKNNFSIIDQKE